jgi:C4-dicarboxylate transporter DctM subunit
MLAAELAKVSMLQAVKAVGPFLLMGILYLLLITFIPQISLWLPNLLS